MSMLDNQELRRISIFDTTLRDGEQAPGNAMRPEQKLELALAIESLGVDVIETGFPSSSPSDFRATRLISEAVSSARIATLNRALRDDVRLAIEAGGTERHHMQIMATGSETHLENKRGITQAEAVREVVDSIEYAKSLGAQHVTLGIEDASRGSDALLRELVVESVGAGADTVTVADTTGCMTPGEFGGLIGRIRGWVPPEVVIATHCHEDLGLSLANALAGIQAGADEVQTCLAGIGERAGNTPLEELIAVLTYKGSAIGATTTAKPDGLYSAFQLLCSVIGLVQPRNKALFGTNAFATQAGIHQAGMLRAPITYEYVEPARFGRERTMLVGRHSGRAVLRYVFEDIGIPVDERVVDTIYEQHVANRTNGECIDLAGIRELILDQMATASGTSA
nr:pyruvate carboxyltransferase [Kibdelosporangium sp. MJ126-NF4]CEL13228.1 2-isopropylmalate synthase [Kibdelosporangium sp. MJ126-NF4]CTQ98919.1 2-isopropylmalate synthase (EC 2.3.3.13) [Kibdelosporangium sp. MJ126-NF4]